MNLWGSLSDGSRVVGEINVVDGTCDTCRRGDVTHCGQRSVLGILKRDGAMAEYLTLPAGNLHRVPDAITDMQAVFVEPLAAALEITDRIHIRPSQRVAIIGDGKLGLLVAQVLQLTGCALNVFGRHARKLAIIRRRGIPTLDASQPNIMEASMSSSIVAVRPVASSPPADCFGRAARWC